jgi:hypothetical protein
MIPQLLPLFGMHRGAGLVGSLIATALCFSGDAEETEVAATPARARVRTKARTVKFFM